MQRMARLLKQRMAKLLVAAVLQATVLLIRREQTPTQTLPKPRRGDSCALRPRNEYKEPRRAIAQRAQEVGNVGL